MTNKFTLRTLSFTALLVLNSTLTMTVERANSQPTNGATVQFKPPVAPSRGAPGKRGAGASRGDCVRSKTPLTVLVPSVDSQKEKNVWGLTTRERPALWVYMPFAPICSTMEFVLKDEAGNIQYQMPVTVPKNPGIISIQLPANVPALKLNQMYNWFLQVRVKPKLVDDLEGLGELFVVDGWIQRIEPNAKLTQKLKQASRKQQVRLYAENGIWFDALTILAKLRLANAKDAATVQHWKSLLQSVGLEEFASEPIVLTNKISPN
jgi:Domain of Unknown Function (DUF928)